MLEKRKRHSGPSTAWRWQSDISEETGVTWTIGLKYKEIYCMYYYSEWQRKSYCNFIWFSLWDERVKPLKLICSDHTQDSDINVKTASIKCQHISIAYKQIQSCIQSTQTLTRRWPHTSQPVTSSLPPSVSWRCEYSNVAFLAPMAQFQGATRRWSIGHKLWMSDL